MQSQSERRSITVAATVLALFPLAIEGGPLWEPLCYAQIGGLTIATFITLLIVPVFYAIFVKDLRLVRWVSGHEEASSNDVLTTQAPRAEPTAMAAAAPPPIAPH